MGAVLPQEGASGFSGVTDCGLGDTGKSGVVVLNENCYHLIA